MNKDIHTHKIEQILCENQNDVVYLFISYNISLTYELHQIMIGKNVKSLKRYQKVCLHCLVVMGTYQETPLIKKILNVGMKMFEIVLLSIWNLKISIFFVK